VFKGLYIITTGISLMLVTYCGNLTLIHTILPLFNTDLVTEE